MCSLHSLSRRALVFARRTCVSLRDAHASPLVEHPRLPSCRAPHGLVAPRPGCSPRALASPRNALECVLSSLSRRALVSARRTCVSARRAPSRLPSLPRRSSPTPSRRKCPPGETAHAGESFLPAKVPSRRKCPPDEGALATDAPSRRMCPPDEKCPPDEGALRSEVDQGLLQGLWEVQNTNLGPILGLGSRCKPLPAAPITPRDGQNAAARRDGQARQAGRQAGKRGRQSVGPFERPSM